MVKKVEVSLEGIGKQIEQAEGKLSAAARGIKNSVQKRRLAAKIKALRKVKSELKEICRGSYNITVPTS